MEFERSLFRIHERLLYSEKSEKIVTLLFKFFAVTCKHSVLLYTAIITFLRFVHFHKSYVNDGSILQREMEKQLLNNTKISYSQFDGAFVYFN